MKEQCGRNEGVGVTGDNIVNFGAVVGEIKATISYAQVKFHCVSIHHLRQQDFLDKITQRFNLPTPFSLTYSSLGGPPENLGEAHQSPEIPQNLQLFQNFPTKLNVASIMHQCLKCSLPNRT